MRVIAIVFLAGLLPAPAGAASDEWPVPHNREAVDYETLSKDAREALREARSYDYEYAGLEAGDQQKAIAAYTRYLQIVNSDEPANILSPMHRIAELNASTMNPAKDEKPDFRAAAAAFEKLLAYAESKGIVSAEVTYGWINYMQYTRNRAGRVERMAAAFAWRERLPESAIENTLGKVDYCGFYVGDKPDAWRRKINSEEEAKLLRANIDAVVEEARSQAMGLILFCQQEEIVEMIERTLTEEQLGPEVWEALRKRLGRGIDLAFKAHEGDLLTPYVPPAAKADSTGDSPSPMSAVLTTQAATASASPERERSRWSIWGGGFLVLSVGLICFAAVWRKRVSRGTVDR